MIREKMNLVCKAGHRSYAPNFRHWVGRDCAHGTCKQPIKLLKPSKGK